MNTKNKNIITLTGKKGDSNYEISGAFEIDLTDKMIEVYYNKFKKHIKDIEAEEVYWIFWNKLNFESADKMNIEYFTEMIKK